MHPAAPTLQPLSCAEPVPGTPEGEPPEEGRQSGVLGSDPCPMASCPVCASQVEREQLSASQSLPGSGDVEECGEWQPQPFPVPSGSCLWQPRSLSSCIRVILQSWAKACSLGLAPEPTRPEQGSWISLPSSQHWTVPAVRASHGALGPDPGSNQLSQKGQPQAPQGGVLCHLCSGAAQGPWGCLHFAGAEAQLRYLDPGSSGRWHEQQVRNGGSSS